MAIITTFLLWALLPGPSARAERPRIQFEAHLFPDSVLVESSRSLALCLVNQGDENRLIRESFRDDDHLSLTIPMGTGDSDLELDGSTIGCSTNEVGWTCSVEVLVRAVRVTLGPSATSVLVPASDTICFNVTGVQVNASEGLSLSRLDQFIHRKRAEKLKNRFLEVFKIANGVVRHDDLTEVRDDQHHQRYQDDEAFQAVLARDGPASGLDADRLDGYQASDFALLGLDEWVKVTGDTMTGKLTLPGDGLVVGAGQLVAAHGKVGVGTAAPRASLHNDGDFITRGPWIDVRAYGAVGDGVHDDTVPLQKAMDAASAAKASLLVPPGTYALGSDLIFKSNVRVLGYGATFELNASRTFWCRIDNGASNVRIEGLTFDAKNNIGSNGRMLTNNGTGSNWRVSGSTFRNTGGDPTATTWQAALFFENGDKIVIEDNEFDNVSSAIFVGQQNAPSKTAAENVTIEGNRITNFTKKAIECRGGTLGGRTYRVIRNWIKVHPAAENAHQIWIDGYKSEGGGSTGTPDNTIRDVTVAFNYCEGNDDAKATGDQIVMHGVEDGVIAFNESVKGGEVGITVAVGSKNVKILGNSVERPDGNGIVIGSTTHPLNDEVEKCFGIVCVGNTLRDVGLQRNGKRSVVFGIRAQRGEGYVIVGNTLYDSQEVATSDNCVRIMPNTLDVEVHGNNQYFAGKTSDSVDNFGLVRDDASDGAFPTDYYAGLRRGNYRRTVSGGTGAATNGRQWTDFFIHETTTSTTDQAWTYPMKKESTIFVKAKVSATNDIMSARALFEVYGVFYRNGGNAPIQQGPTTKPVAIERPGGWDVDFSISGNDVRLDVTSPTLNEVPWVITLEVEEVLGTP